MKRILISLAALAAASVANAQTPQGPAAARAGKEATASVRLEVGESRDFHTDAPIKQLLMSAAGVINIAAPTPRDVRITGERLGSTELTIVTATDRIVRQVEVGAPGAAEAARISKVLAADADFAKIAVAKPDDAITLSGAVADQETALRAEAIAAATGGKTVAALEVTGRQMVAVDVRFIAISDRTLKSLGFNFSKLGQGFEWAVLGPNSLKSFSAGGSGLEIEATHPFSNAFNLLLHDRNEGVLGVISALSDAGLSHVLAQPTLMARSGERASFLAGGEVPIPVPQAGVGNGVIAVDYRTYGVQLAVEPFVLSDRKILLKLAPEVSELDYTTRVQLSGFSIPGFRRRSASTTVELGDGQSFVIAGLTYSVDASNESKIPGLGELPVLGAFFKTAERSREKLELIIIATPRIVSPLESTDLADIDGAPPPPAPSMTDVILGLNGPSQRATRVGLSR